MRCNNRSNECEKMWNLLAMCPNSLAARIAPSCAEKVAMHGGGGVPGGRARPGVNYNPFTCA